MTQIVGTVFIISPFSGEVERNREHAKQMCRDALSLRLAPFAPHLFYPQFLDDGKAEERELGILCGRELMGFFQRAWISTEYGVSEGMRGDIGRAQVLGMRLCRWQPNQKVQSGVGGKTTAASFTITPW